MHIPEPLELHHPKSEKVSQHLADSTIVQSHASDYAAYIISAHKTSRTINICTIHINMRMPAPLIKPDFIKNTKISLCQEQPSISHYTYNQLCSKALNS